MECQKYMQKPGILICVKYALEIIRKILMLGWGEGEMKVD